MTPRQWERPRVLGREPGAIRRVVRLLCVGVCSLAACIHNPPDVAGKPSAPRSPTDLWTPPAQAITRDSIPASTIPPDIASRVAHLTLADVVDVALANNPVTRQSYAQARAAGATIGAAYGRYLPQLTVSGAAIREGATSVATSPSGIGGLVPIGGYHTLEQADGSLSWLLFDFGEFASLRYARNTAFAASFNFNATLQTLVLSVEQAYFSYNSAKAIRDADMESVREDSVSLVAARARHNAGVVTIEDVLTAQATLSQAELTVETDVGTVETTRGALAVAMGLPANLPYDIAPEPPRVPIASVTQSVDTLVALAIRSRPDLAAARAELRQAQANVGIVRGQGLPSITFGGSAGRANFDTPRLDGNTYTAQVGVSIPLFQGFTNSYDLLQARELAKAAAANAVSQRDLVVNQVFVSYYDLRTAAARVTSSDDLLASTRQAYAVATAEYHAGTATILTVLTAEALLASARSQQASARWTWYSSLAQLSHDVGVIGVHGEVHLPMNPDSSTTPP